MGVFRVGVVIKPHGVKGAVKVFPTTSDQTRFKLLKQVRFGRTDSEEDISEVFEIQSVQFFKNQVILKLKGIDSVEEAEKLRNGSLWIPDEDALPLEENEYFLRDFLEGEVFTEEGTLLGTIYDILETGSNEVFVIRTKEQQEILLPVIKDCILSMDPVGHKVVVRLMKGMLE